MLRKVSAFSLLVLAAVSVAIFVGCNDSQTEVPPAGGSNPPAQVKASVGAKEGEHGHKPGGHGGIIVEIGRDSYHAEAVFEKGGTLRLYTLGKDESRIQEVEEQTLTAY